jgi:hypothetical protein
VEREVSISEFIKAIELLPEDESLDRQGIWYKTQRQHWLGWLDGYYGPGAYSRKNWKRDARFVYNHVVCPGLLLYLIRAIPLSPDIVKAAEEASEHGTTQMEKAGAIRRVAPWSMIYQALFSAKKPSFFDRLRIRRQQN